MQKKSIIKIILILFLMIPCTVVPISYARYISDLNGLSKIDIAKWKLIINDKSIEENFELDLFETANNNNIKEGTKTIAPGSTGKIELNIINDSDVVAEYTITVEETSNESNIPILYSLEEGAEYKELNELFFGIDNEIGIGDNNTDIITLYWKWDFYKDANQNQLDNELGENGNGIVEITINIKAKQKIDE